MRSATVFTALLAGKLATASPVDAGNELVVRAAPANAPNGYVPQSANCPSTPPSVRDAADLSDQEKKWLPTRRSATMEPMQDLLKRLSLPGFDVDDYFSKNKGNVSNLPNIGIAISGGGYRAMLNGAGHIHAFDSRTSNATSAGQLGGLLQSATYLSGLSGGSWLVGSLYSNNFTSIDTIVNDNTGSLWQFGNSVFKGPKTGGINLLHSVGYYKALVDAVKAKSDAGFNTSITDFWGRSLSYQLVNATDGGPDFTWSSIADQDWFTSGTAPMPIIITDSRVPGTLAVPGNATIFSFDPWEMGSPDPTIFGYIPMKYVGTDFKDGKPAEKCVTGFDNVGFVMGSSSTLFNQALIRFNKQSGSDDSWGSSLVTDAINSTLTALGEDHDDVASYPNPFQGYNSGMNPFSSTERLVLVDGGEDGENIPLHPLIQPQRDVDVIFAVDTTADTKASNPANGSAPGWPTGEAIMKTYTRSIRSIQNGTGFPSIPDENTFLNLGLNNRPTFFGCDARNLTKKAPLIVYLPNAPYVYYSNKDTFDLEYNNTERDAMILNGYYSATQGNGTLDKDWPACVGCAILARSFNRTETKTPDICNQCFDKYCWNGTLDNSPPKAYAPELKLPKLEVKVSAARHDASLSLFTPLVVALGVALALI